MNDRSPPLDRPSSQKTIFKTAYRTATFFPPEPTFVVCSTCWRNFSRVLLLLAVPGHLIFCYAITVIEGHQTPTPIFLLFYLLAAIAQVSRTTLLLIGSSQPSRRATFKLLKASQILEGMGECD